MKPLVKICSLKEFDEKYLPNFAKTEEAQLAENEGAKWATDAFEAIRSEMMGKKEPAEAVSL